MEYVHVIIDTRYSNPSREEYGHEVANLKIYPSGGAWSAHKFSELSGSTTFDRKILVRVPLNYIYGPPN